MHGFGRAVIEIIVALQGVAVQALMKSNTLLCLNMNVHITAGFLKLNYVKCNKSSPSCVTSPRTAYQSDSSSLNDI